MKVIIPVAGAGTTLRPFTYTQPKCLIPLAGKTILSFILEQFIEMGINDFVFIIGHLGDKIQNYVADNYPNINANFAVQNERAGTGHAIYLAENFIDKNEPIIICYGDTICDYDIEKLVHNEHSIFCTEKVEDPWNFGVVELNANDTVVHVAEKPSIPKSNLALVGIYKIVESSLLFKTLGEGIKSADKENKYQLTDAIESMLQKNVKFEIMPVENWYDCGKKNSLLETNATLLQRLEFYSDEVPFFDNTIIIHPVNIADGCNIQNAIIGPYVTIGDNAKINGSIISNSIIGSFAQLDKVVLDYSLIGSDAFVRGNSQSLNIGDNTEIDLK
jgi:glucose-1-phosphate thymidylyltransferase